jgi:DNA invertase Pin-like site-specific DNA recombinase
MEDLVSEKEWRCRQCGTLLGVERGGKLHLKYKTAQFVVARCLAFEPTHGNHVTRVERGSIGELSPRGRPRYRRLRGDPSRWFPSRPLRDLYASVGPAPGSGHHPLILPATARALHRVHAVASRPGWYPLGEHFDDEGYSGATVERPALERLVERIQRGDIRRVIVYRVDRLTRKLSDWAHLVTLFDRFGVGLTVVSGALDIEAGTMARFQLNMLATLAELELDMIGEGLRDARTARNARGLRTAGRVSFGYTADRQIRRLSGRAPGHRR